MARRRSMGAHPDVLKFHSLRELGKIASGSSLRVPVATTPSCAAAANPAGLPSPSLQRMATARRASSAAGAGTSGWRVGCVDVPAAWQQGLRRVESGSSRHSCVESRGSSAGCEQGACEEERQQRVGAGAERKEGAARSMGGGGGLGNRSSGSQQEAGGSSTPPLTHPPLMLPGGGGKSIRERRQGRRSSMPSSIFLQHYQQHHPSTMAAGAGGGGGAGIPGSGLGLTTTLLQVCLCEGVALAVWIWVAGVIDQRIAMWAMRCKKRVWHVARPCLLSSVCAVPQPQEC
eukprot:1147766-Pelagomonas_calceolata.AAC.3